MSPLPTGITVFGPSPQDQSVNMRSFTAACHTAARALGGRVASVREANTGTLNNFHEATLSLPQQEDLRVLCNAYSPLVAFARVATDKGEMNLAFFENPLLASALTDQWEVLTLKELQEFPDTAALSLLSEAELKQLQYWKPETVGQIVFNYWD